MTIQIRIFMGYVQNKEVNLHLGRSASWKEEKLLGNLHLVETRWQDKDYIGFFISSFMTYDQLKEKEKEVKTQLQHYCPKLNLDKHAIHLFSQSFLG